MFTVTTDTPLGEDDRSACLRRRGDPPGESTRQETPRRHGSGGPAAGVNGFIARGLRSCFRGRSEGASLD